MAAREAIRHISEASKTNPLVQELRFHGFFIGSCAFALIYDMLHDQSMISTHLPWVNTGLRYLSQMREGEPITSTIRAVNLALDKLNQGQMTEVSEPSSSFARLSPEIAEAEARSEVQEFANITQNSTWNGLSPSLPSNLETFDGSGDLGIWRIDPSMVTLEGFFSWPLQGPFQ
ncbi:hypothetical protein N7520_010915 [Penicillium odoratum]|uniref:uncharacterized protein n=1 Tax=Penicillium odoratum TaxID=1167516 RepID=UPI00254686D4|nr:uncharacterized protein N7520_010915 [Penicillium odoratum]KAJ5745733.1 hypothetical protein N7520_010915 [Penicillium odoratum]